MSKVEHVPALVVSSTPPGCLSSYRPVNPVTLPAESRSSWIETCSWTAPTCGQEEAPSLESVDACRKSDEVAANARPRSTNGVELEGPASANEHVVEQDARTTSRAWLPSVGTGSPV